MLSDAEIRKIQPSLKRRTIRDSEGLYLEITEKGTKTWKIRIMVDGVAVKRTLGRYPDVSLREARLLRDKIRLEIREHGVQNNRGNSFSSLAEEWFTKQIEHVKSGRYAIQVRQRLDRHILPFLGGVSIDDLSAPKILSVLRPIESAGSLEMAHRIVGIIGQICRYGIATGRCERDHAADLRGALVPKRTQHHPTITDPNEIGALMRAIHGFSGTVIVRCMLLLQIYTATRPGETRLAEWREFDGDLWRIPESRMKMRRPHLVPLSSQALSVLEELRPVTGSGGFLFPSLRSQSRPISDATANAALRRLGYAQNELVVHGFRAMFSTTANEHQWPSDVIERHLAHVEGNSVRAAYNHAEYLGKRREMMQWWGDWLDGVKERKA